MSNIELLDRTVIAEKIQDISVTELIRSTYNQLPELAQNMNVIENHVYMNLTNGEIFNHISIGNSFSFERNHYLKLYSISTDTINNIPSEDLSGDDKLPESGDAKDYEDYDERVIKCLIYYADYQLDIVSIEEQLDYIYN